VLQVNDLDKLADVAETERSKPAKRPLM